ncbi:hypothetical protein C8J57DRAFT_1166320, partial [Mycena rebaudengoi]
MGLHSDSYDSDVLELKVTGIHGDRLEHDRMQLEHNLRTEFSYPLPSPADDDDTLEYPRHNSNPAAFPDFASFDQRSRDNFDPDISHIHAWSYRTGDDEEGISPYGGETLSTAAHHASALTLSAGLGGRGGHRREISLSGAEYDPDRQLHDMIAAVDPKLSMFDMDPEKSRYGLDRVLQSGAQQPASRSRSRSVRIRSPQSSATSSSASSDSDSPRPRLADALQRVSFSPKRPRSPQTIHHPNHRNAHVPPSPLTRPADETPRPPRRTSATTTPASNFTRAARGLTRDLVEQQNQNHDRNPFTDIANHADRRSHSKSRVQLPDVTGLTSAVESPAKPMAGYNAYYPDERPRDSEARLLSTLSVVQAKLHQLEDQNGISRRRVRELELELEECKREVARERTRVLEQGEASGVQKQARPAARDKGKARAVYNVSIDAGEVGERYREAVEEKKALESLIASLRTHLTRLTSELSAHQELLTELRKLRERDSRALKEKGDEVDRLRREVERLAGEVEVLRGVVEEGLRERRAVREATMTTEPSAADVAMSEDLELDSEEGEEGEAQQDDPLDDRSSLEEEDEEEEDDDDETEAEPFDPLSILGSSRENGGASGSAIPDRTVRTDHATRGSGVSNNNSGNNTTANRFIGDEEVARVAADMEERRAADRSAEQEREREREHEREREREREHERERERERERQRNRTTRSPVMRNHNHNRRATVEEVSDAGTERGVPRAGPSQPRQQQQQSPPQLARPTVPTPSRPAVPTPSRARRDRYAASDVDDDAGPATPFPQIRGARLERLFFSAPPHDRRTCAVCCRRTGVDAGVGGGWGRRGRGHGEDEHREDGEEDEDEDEGFVEGFQREHARGGGNGDDNNNNDYEAAARKAGLPAQTLVARVIRELEDDFTHYKSVYVELADQYKGMDAVSDVPRRNMVARHLREVVDVLEQKGDQIASLYDCLTFKDKPVPVPGPKKNVKEYAR